MTENQGLDNFPCEGEIKEAIAATFEPMPQAEASAEVDNSVYNLNAILDD